MADDRPSLVRRRAVPKADSAPSGGSERSERGGVDVAVVVERSAAPNRWEDWGFRIAEVVPDEGAYGREPRVLVDDGRRARLLHPGFRVELYADECKGYFLNLTSGRPSWFVSWLQREDDPSMIDVTGVSVSYIEADRRMTAEEHVESLPLPDELCEWLRVYTNEHFRPDEPRKVRAQSFLSPHEREALSQELREAQAIELRQRGSRRGDG